MQSKYPIKSPTFFATCPKNLENLLEAELKALGAKFTKQTLAGVTFSGPLTLAYRACLWSRLANRILLPLREVNAVTAQALYEGVQEISWLDHLRPTDSFIVDFSGTSPNLKNSHFGALKVKDAIVDQIRAKTGQRPDIDKLTPTLRINVYLYNQKATVSIDLSGASLHQRGYREQAGLAPLKENLAAAILQRANWLDFAQTNKPLLDPMCGSGTILIEAAMMAYNYAPGLLRQEFGFSKWLNHKPKLWQELVLEARETYKTSLTQPKVEIRGYDTDPKMVSSTKRNIQNAGLAPYIDVSFKPMERFTPPTHHGNQYGLIVTNPPYGERLNTMDDITKLYQDFGKVLRDRFEGWHAAILTSNQELGKALGIHSHKQYNFFNGAIPCKLIMLQLKTENFYRRA